MGPHYIILTCWIVFFLYWFIRINSSAIPFIRPFS
jgi:hypothetical protein